MPQVLRCDLARRRRSATRPSRSSGSTPRRPAPRATTRRTPRPPTTTPTVPTTCFGCHLRDFTTAATPVNHAGLPTTCDSCHKNTDATWLLATAFNHCDVLRRSPARTRPRPAPVPQPAVRTQRQQLHQRAHEPVLGLPSEGLQQRQDAGEPHRVALPDDLRHMPQVLRCDLARRRRSATRPSRSSASTPRRRAPTCHNPPYAPSANNYSAVPTTCFGCHHAGLRHRRDTREPRRSADDVRQLPQEHGRRPGCSRRPSTIRRTSRSPARTRPRPAASATTRRTPPAPTTSPACPRARAPPAI